MLPVKSAGRGIDHSPLINSPDKSSPVVIQRLRRIGSGRMQNHERAPNRNKELPYRGPDTTGLIPDTISTGQAMKERRKNEYNDSTKKQLCTKNQRKAREGGHGGCHGSENEGGMIMRLPQDVPLVAERRLGRMAPGGLTGSLQMG